MIMIARTVAGGGRGWRRRRIAAGRGLLLVAVHQVGYSGTTKQSKAVPCVASQRSCRRHGAPARRGPATAGGHPPTGNK